MNKTYQSLPSLPGSWRFGLFCAFCCFWALVLWTLPDALSLQEWSALWNAPTSLVTDALSYSPWFRELWSPGRQVLPLVAFQNSLWILWGLGFLTAFFLALRSQPSDSWIPWWGLAFLISVASSEGIRSIVVLIFGVAAVLLVHFDAYAKRVSWWSRGMTFMGAGILFLCLGLILGQAGLVISISALAAAGLAVFVSPRSMISILVSQILFVACFFIFWIPYVYPFYQKYLSSGLDLEAFLLSQFAGHIDSINMDPWTFFNSQKLVSTPEFVATLLWVCPLIWICLRVLKNRLPPKLRVTILESENKAWFWQGWAWAVSIWPLTSLAPELRPLAWMVSLVMMSGFLALNQWSHRWRWGAMVFGLGTLLVLLVQRHQSKPLLASNSGGDQTLSCELSKIELRGLPS